MSNVRSYMFSKLLNLNDTFGCRISGDTLEIAEKCGLGGKLDH